MINWSLSMQQTFEFYTVDPATWKDNKLVLSIKNCTINRDSTNGTLGSASMDTTSIMEECYLRVYLVIIQNEKTEKIPLGTFLVQTPSVNFDGKTHYITMDAYTPLIELKGNMPPLGYSILKGEPVMSIASYLCHENARAPVVAPNSDTVLNSDFVANLNDTWLTFVTDLISTADYTLSLDELGRILFEPKQDMASLRPVWTYNDDNSSILYPDVKDERDLYGIPNVVEVTYSTDSGYLFSRIVNDDPNSPTSTINRGREITYRESSPSFPGTPTQELIDSYAMKILRDLSSLEHTITYTHGYCPVRIGDCVTLNYERSGLINVKAKVIAQNIKCEVGCPVEETAVYTTKLWR